MGLFYDSFNSQISRLWDFANKTAKPIHPSLSWTSGIINCKGDFLDLQSHGIALASSVIIQSDVVPQIFFGWDSVYDYEVLAHSEKLRRKTYPLYMMRRFEGFNEEMVAAKKLFDCYELKTRYVNLNKASLSVNTWPTTLAIGYRAKYLGMPYVMTEHAIVSDIDTVCVAPCVEYLDDQIKVDRSTFVITNWYNHIFLSVGLCVYNVHKYRNVFLPLFYRDYWRSWRQDSSFVQFVRNNHPEFADTLDLRLMDKNKISTERFYRSKARKNYWTPDTMIYHAWKGESKRNEKGFLDYYQQILDDLERKVSE